MKRGMILLGLSAMLATPAAAQWLGMPVWNSPKGGTGITISGDLAKPDSSYGKGTAFGARGSLGLGNLNLTLGLSSWKPEGAANSLSHMHGRPAAIAGYTGSHRGGAIGGRRVCGSGRRAQRRRHVGHPRAAPHRRRLAAHRSVGGHGLGDRTALAGPGGPQRGPGRIERRGRVWTDRHGVGGVEHENRAAAGFPFRNVDHVPPGAGQAVVRRRNHLGPPCI